jgi:hypothetical protein
MAVVLLVVISGRLLLGGFLLFGLELLLQLIDVHLEALGQREHGFGVDVRGAGRPAEERHAQRAAELGILQIAERHLFAEHSSAFFAGGGDSLPVADRRGG